MDDWEPPVQRTHRPEPAPMWPLYAGAVVLAGTLGVGVWAFFDDLRSWWAGTPPAAQVDAGQGGDAGTGPSITPAEGDPILRKLAEESSASPLLAAWLGAPNLIHRLTAATVLVAEGKTPRPVLTFVELPDFEPEERLDPPPKGAKKKKRSRRAKARGVERLFLTPESYARYDALVGAITAIDAAKAATMYSAVRPFFEAAYAEVAKPGERFDDVLTSAIRRLVGVKVEAKELELVPKGAVYAFKDPALESLSSAEKCLLRMGPKNAAGLQGALRRFAESAGLRLESPRTEGPASW